MRTANVREVAQIVRSMNAGPFRLTLDILFTDRAVYEQAKKSKRGHCRYHRRALQAARGPRHRLRLVRPRQGAQGDPDPPVSSASPLDRDIYGAQQHAPLLAPHYHPPGRPLTALQLALTADRSPIIVVEELLQETRNVADA